MKKETTGILQMIACAGLWSIAGIFMKQLPWSGLAVASLRSLVAGLTFAVYMALRHIRFSVNPRILITGVLTGSVYICFSVANKLTTAANAIVLQFTDPVFLLLFSALLFKKKIRRADLLVVLVVLAGITLFFFDQLGPSTVVGNFFAIAAGMLLAGMYLGVETLEQDERFSAIMIGQCVAFLAGLPTVLTTQPLLNAATVGSILVLGVFQLGIAYILYVKASVNCSPLTCCLLGAFEPLLNPIWVMLFDGETPGIYALLGGVIIIVSVTSWTVWDQKQAAPAPQD